MLHLIRRTGAAGGAARERRRAARTDGGLSGGKRGGTFSPIDRRNREKGAAAWRGIWPGLCRAGAAMLLLTGIAAAAPGVEDAPADDAAQSTQPVDKLSMIPTSNDAWGVSDTDAGCYLLSPRQKGGSSLAIGWRADQTFGLFLVSLGMAVPTANTGEPVLIQADGRQISGSARMIGFRLFFIPLDAAATGSVLQELRDSGMLWLKVQHTWIAHGGRGLAAALASYSQTCSAAVRPR
jgi:hypothetical protein